MKIVICGGHLTPALATIEALKKEKKDLQIFFFGRLHPLEGDPSFSAESQIIPSLGIPFYPIISGRLQRKFTSYTIISLLKIPVGLIQAFFLLLKVKPAVICSFGSYVAVPTVIAGWLLRIPIITHEQTQEAGLASKIIALLAQKIAVSWPKSLQYFPVGKTVSTGNPLRWEIFNKQAKDKKLQKFLDSSGVPLLFVTGGNQGSHQINQAVGEILPVLIKNYRLIIQTGGSKIYQDFEDLNRLARNLSSEDNSRLYLARYLDQDNIGAVLNGADLIICRAGANIVWEIGTLGKVAIFVPIPWSQHDEQTKNAQVLAKAKSAIILPQEKLSGQSLSEQIKLVFSNFEDFKQNARKAEKNFRRDAAPKLARVILALAQD